jgi:succinate-semialdehyde dehydrogenase/glutarate-semialdehyde dehydrogenase
MNISSGGGALDLRDPLLFRRKCYVDGRWTGADSGKTLPVDNPATGEILGTIPDAREAETRRALEAANSAFPAWRAKTAKERATILRKWFELMRQPPLACKHHADARS